MLCNLKETIPTSEVIGLCESATLHTAYIKIEVVWWLWQCNVEGGYHHLEELLSMESVHSSEMFMPISCNYGIVMQRTTVQGWS